LFVPAAFADACNSRLFLVIYNTRAYSSGG
jgi:hypothetical protein